jgi:hypothetical protein
VAAVLAGHGRREVAIQVREQRARHVRLGVLLLAQRGLGEVVAAIEHPPLGVLRELFGGDQRGKCGAQAPSPFLSHSWKCTIASSMGDW